MTSARISYGKLEVPVHRIGVTPLHGLPEIPESPVRSLDHALFGCVVGMEVLGQVFLPAYTEGDNSRVVATDTMKNVILKRALDYDGATLEGFLDQLGRSFLERYEDMEGLRVMARQLPFQRVTDKLFSLVDGDHGVAELEFARSPGGVELVVQDSGHVGMRLLKTTGSAFTKFARDDDTTLPERGDRPLFLHFDVHWTYSDPADALAADPARYVAPVQVRDVCAAVFDEFVSESIQQLVYVMGERLLERFPGLTEVRFKGENHTHDPIAGSVPGDQEGPHAYTSAFPAWGLITLALRR